MKIENEEETENGGKESSRSPSWRRHKVGGGSLPGEAESLYRLAEGGGGIGNGSEYPYMPAARKVFDEFPSHVRKMLSFDGPTLNTSF